jgi:hypothetical protein
MQVILGEEAPRQYRVMPQREGNEINLKEGNQIIQTITADKLDSNHSFGVSENNTESYTNPVVVIVIVCVFATALLGYLGNITS